VRSPPARVLGRTERGHRAAGISFWTMSPTWIWMQGAIVLFVLIGMIIAITKLV
jgi:hypothetical protein